MLIEEGCELRWSVYHLCPVALLDPGLAQPVRACDAYPGAYPQKSPNRATLRLLTNSPLRRRTLTSARSCSTISGPVTATLLRHGSLTTLSVVRSGIEAHLATNFGCATVRVRRLDGRAELVTLPAAQFDQSAHGQSSAHDGHDQGKDRLLPGQEIDEPSSCDDRPRDDSPSGSR